jgi:hypothetical protein
LLPTTPITKMLRRAIQKISATVVGALSLYAVVPAQHIITLVQYAAERYQTWQQPEPEPEPRHEDIESESLTTPTSTPSLSDCSTLSWSTSSEDE